MLAFFFQKLSLGNFFFDSIFLNHMGAFFFFRSDKNLPSFEDYAGFQEILNRKIEAAEQFISNDPTLSKYLLQAKEEYVAITGRLNEGEEGYLQRIKAFLIWFLFSWELPPKMEETPFSRFKNSLSDQKEKEIAAAMEKNIHSLFLFEKKAKNGVHVRDLFTKKRYFLAHLESFDGFENGFWFETRLFPVEGAYVVADYIILHPKSLLKAIGAQIKKYQPHPKAFFGFLLQLQNYYSKWKNYKKIDVESIYTFHRK